MTKKTLAILAAGFCSVVLSGPLSAADARPPADPTKPATTARVGGSPADARFRDANQKSAAAYRKARDTCRSQPKGDQSACLTTARSELRRAQAEAKAARDAGNRSR